MCYTKDKDKKCKTRSKIRIDKTKRAKKKIKN